ncbi:MAG: ABC-2 family transporter protein [archaeon]
MKYLRLFNKTFALELSSEMAYKTNFLIKSLALITADLIGPLVTLLIYNNSSGIPGWSFEEFLLFQGTFVFIMGLSHFSLIMLPYRVIDNVREGTFDKVLIKPYNPLLYLSFTSVDLEGLAEVFAGLFLIVYSFIKLNLILFSFNSLFYIFLVVIGFIFLYSVFVLMSALAFLFVKSFGLFDLFFKIMDVGRYPITIYEGGMRFLFTFIIPIGIVSFYPASVLIRGLNLLTVIEIIIPISLFLIFSIWMWNRAIKKYTSAGG